MMHTQEADGGRGIPHLFVGLYPTIDDVAKLSALLQHGGQHQDQQILHAGKLAEALYQTNAMGLPNNTVKNRFGEGRYHLSLWSVPYRATIECVFQIPFTMGFGGNLVVLLPNGLSAFRFADGQHYNVDTMVLAGEVIRPFPCPAGSGEAPAVHQPLTASALRAELPGPTFYTGPMNIFIAADGCCTGRSNVGPTAPRSKTWGRGISRQRGSGAGRGAGGITGGNAATSCTGRARPSNCPSKTDCSAQDLPNASPATRRAIELRRLPSVMV